MAWRGPHGGPDPLLWKRRWRTGVRAYWVEEGRRQGHLRCARCHRLIDFLAPKYYPNTKIINPRSLVIGHIRSRSVMTALGYDDHVINDLANSQPECARCSWTSGAKQGNLTRRIQEQSVASSRIDSAPSVLTSQTLQSRW
jgi:hypothetical protein